MNLLNDFIVTRTFRGEEGLRQLYPMNDIIFKMQGGEYWLFNTDPWATDEADWTLLTVKNQPYNNFIYDLESTEMYSQNFEISLQVEGCVKAWVLDH